MTERRTFLRACIAGAGAILVPQYVDRYRWKGYLYVPSDAIYTVGQHGFYVGAPLASFAEGHPTDPRGFGIVREVGHGTRPWIAIDWQWRHP